MSSITELLQRLLDDPDNESLLSQTGSQLRENPRQFAQAAKQVVPFQPLPMARVGEGFWSNVTGNQFCHPSAILHPKSLEDLVDAVTKAHGKQTVRAVGSGHSFSDVAVTDGLLLDPHGMNQVLPLDASMLKDASDSATLFSVQSGITIADLNEALDQAGVALVNMGAYDGQTLAGAISTGTHGTGASLGPIASSVRSLIVVSESGTIYQIEPTNGITDPAKFAAKYPGVVLKQDDDWFQSNVVAMGCMGLIYSYTLEVIPAYFLLENRTKTTWELLKPQLLNASPGQLPSIITAHRHFEIDVNPYALDNGAHTCIVTTRDIHPGPRCGSRGFANWLSGLLGETELVQSAMLFLFNHIPRLTPYLVDKALDTLKDSNYVNKSYKVLNLGDVNSISAYAVELSFDATRFVDSIDGLFKLLAAKAESDRWYQTGPIGIRFVAPAEAYLAPQYGRVTCMAELDMLNGIKNGAPLLNLVQKAMCSSIEGTRVHWGLELDALQGDQVPKMYPQYDRWLGVYHQLNSTGMFDSSFTKRMGISTASA